MKDFIQTASPLLAVLAIMTAYAIGGELACAVAIVAVFTTYEFKRTEETNK